METRTPHPPNSASPKVTLGRPNLWLLPVLTLILLAIFATLFDNGALLAAPLLGEAAWEKNYLHEFFHDGRHLLSVPCH